MPTLAIHFARYGPYHHARLASAYSELAPKGWTVIGLEAAGQDTTYDWDTVEGADEAPDVVTVFPGRNVEDLSAPECHSEFGRVLDRLNPDAVAIAGWGTPDARACLDWCRKHDIKTVVMSETREADGPRAWWKEWLKSFLISRFDGGLVGAQSHRDYLVRMGIPVHRVKLGYNVVDNVHFASACEEWRREADGVDSSPQFFLASNRFIERKNLSWLIDAFAGLDQAASDSANHKPWSLCLLGDGELAGTLKEQCRNHGLEVVEAAPWESADGPDGGRPKVFFPGFRQIDQLPKFYAHASCFVHPALAEPWGLVINEAMAAGLPILSSNNVGAAERLVDDGVNGGLFDAMDVGSITQALNRIIALDSDGLQAMGAASLKILEDRNPLKAFGVGLAEVLHELKITPSAP